MIETKESAAWKKALKNKNLIWKVINRDIKYNGSISREDLYQEGMLALYKACLYENKAKEKGTSTYMTSWIKYTLWSYIRANQGTVYIPKDARVNFHYTNKEEFLEDTSLPSETYSQEDYLLENIAETIEEKNARRILLRKKGKVKKLTESEKFAILNLYPSKTTKEIADIFGLSISTISRLRQKASLGGI